MTSTQKYGITKFRELNYLQIVVDFIYNHPGCTATYLLSKESKNIGKKRLYQTILPTLRRKKIIREEKKLHKRGRDIMLFIREDNPIYIASKELREFESLYPSLLTSLKEQLERWQSGKHLLKPTYLPGSRGKKEYEWDTEPSDVAAELIIDSTLLLFETMRTNMLRTIITWSRLIEEKYTREILNFMIFSKFYKMQIKVSEVLGDVKIIDKDALILSVGTELAEIEERIQHALYNLDKYEIIGKIEPIVSFVKKFIWTEMARYQIYSKSSVYKWKISDKDVEEQAKNLAKDNPTRSENENMKWDIASMNYDTMMGK
jgi:hypothetical protein